MIMDEQNLTKKERRQLRREEKRRDIEHAKDAKKQKGLAVWVGVFLLIALGIFGVYRYFSGLSPEEVSSDVTRSCVTHSGGMHIHPGLSIFINGEEEDLSTNIGVSPGCMRPVHTHDSTGQLHAEFPRPHDLTLADFFKIWDKPFSSFQILDYVIDDTHALTMTVNGRENSEFENLILRDGDRIEIIYEEKEIEEAVDNTISTDGNTTLIKNATTVVE